MHHKQREQLDEFIVQVIDDCISNKLIERKKYTDQYSDYLKRYKHLRDSAETKAKFNRSYIRLKALIDLKVYFLLLKFPIFRNIVINEHIDKIEKENIPIYRRMFELKNKGIHYKDDTMVMKMLESRPPITHIRIPRGEIKTSMFICARGVFIYLRDCIFIGRPPSIMFGHGDLSKAKKNLQQAKNYMNTDIIQYLYNDVLDPIVDSAERMRFDVAGDGTMNEDHFQVTSVDADDTGKHPTYFMLDDWVTPENCMTKDRVTKTTNSFWNIWWLNDHSGLRRIEKAGTAYAKGSVDEDLRKMSFEENSDVVFTEYGATYKNGIEQFDENNEPIYYFPYNPEYNAKGLARARKILPKHQFLSQIQMIPYDLDEKRLLFDTPLPVYYKPYVDESKREFEEHSVILIDPAVSKRNKKSRMTILVCSISNTKKLFVIDGFSSRGTTPSFFLDKILEFVKMYNTDHLIIESVAAQEYMMMHIMEKFDDEGIECNVISHRHTESKAMHYKSYLEPLLNQGKIYVNDNLHELKRQLNSESDLNDEVDCLAFIKELKIAWQDIITMDSNVYDIRGVKYAKEKQDTFKPNFSSISPYI